MGDGVLAATGAALALAVVVAGIVADAAEPVFTFVGGGSAVGVALRSAREWGREADPDWGRAAGIGAIWGAFFGSGILFVDVVVG
jgi:acetylornithine/succinyldiaminopimelate/putrescine aminotransferase